jgi:hypothetical protein
MLLFTFRPAVVTVYLSMVCQLAVSAECTVTSGPHLTPLLELYTSEGCSSCPPADQWLSQQPKSAKQFVPLAFHVDYWNYIGWEDRFSKAEFSARQRSVAKFNQSTFVYTPQFVLNGQDFKGINNRFSQTINKLQQQPAGAKLALSTSPLVNGNVQLTINADLLKPNTTQAAVYIALYENNLSSEIKAGENSGRLLKHDFVVRELYGAYSLKQNQAFSHQWALTPKQVANATGAVAFVQENLSGEILQSVQLAFCTP